MTYLLSILSFAFFFLLAATCFPLPNFLWLFLFPAAFLEHTEDAACHQNQDHHNNGCYCPHGNCKITRRWNHSSAFTSCKKGEYLSWQKVKISVTFTIIATTETPTKHIQKHVHESDLKVEVLTFKLHPLCPTLWDLGITSKKNPLLDSSCSCGQNQSNYTKYQLIFQSFETEARG